MLRQVTVRSRGDLVDAVNLANAEPQNDIDAMVENGAYGDFEFTGRGSLRIVGVGADKGAVFGGTNRGAGFHVYSAPNFRGGLNFELDGAGRNLWGVVLGSRYRGDKKAGPVVGAVFEDVSAGYVGQETWKIAGSSNHCVFRRVDGHHTGMSGEWGEAFYTGQGGDVTDRPHNLEFYDIRAWHVRHGEAMDVKVSTRLVTVDGFEFTDVTAPYAGALTIGADKSNGGHNLATRHVFQNGRISNVRKSGKYGVHGIQVGTDCLIKNVHVEDVPDGYAVDVVKQFGGPNKIVRLQGVTAQNVDGRIRINENAPSGGNLPGEVRGTVTEGPAAVTPAPVVPVLPPPVPQEPMPPAHACPDATLADVPEMVATYGRRAMFDAVLDA